MRRSPGGKRPFRTAQGQSGGEGGFAGYVVVIIDIEKPVPGRLRKNDKSRQHQQTADNRRGKVIATRDPRLLSAIRFRGARATALLCSSGHLCKYLAC